MDINIQQMGIFSMPDQFENQIKNLDSVNSIVFNNFMKSFGLLLNSDEPKNAFGDFNDFNDLEKEIYPFESNRNSFQELIKNFLSGNKQNVFEKEEILSWINKINEIKQAAPNINDIEKAIEFIFQYVKKVKENNNINEGIINLYDKLIDLKYKIEQDGLKQSNRFNKNEQKQISSRYESKTENIRSGSQPEQDYDDKNIVKVEEETENKFNDVDKKIVFIQPPNNEEIKNNENDIVNGIKETTEIKKNSNNDQFMELFLQDKLIEKPETKVKSNRDIPAVDLKKGKNKSFINDAAEQKNDNSGNYIKTGYDQKKETTTGYMVKNDVSESSQYSIDKQKSIIRFDEISNKNTIVKNKTVDHDHNSCLENNYIKKEIQKDEISTNNDQLLVGKVENNELGTTPNNNDEMIKNNRKNDKTTLINATHKISYNDTKEAGIGKLDGNERQNQEIKFEDNEFSEKMNSNENKGNSEQIKYISIPSEENENRPEIKKKYEHSIDDIKEMNNNSIKTEKHVSEVEKAENMGNVSARNDQKHSNESLKIHNNNAMAKTGDEIKKFTDKSVVDQIIKKAVLELGQNKSELKINIKPESLGAINIQVVSENEHLTAKITTETQSVKNIIEQNLDQFKSDLSKSGMEFDGIDVSVGNQSQFDQSWERDEIAKQMKHFEKIYRQADSEKSETSNKNDRAKGKLKESAVDYYA
jgi:flagellar hook-length control protein FliK